MIDTTKDRAIVEAYSKGEVGLNNYLAVVRPKRLLKMLDAVDERNMLWTENCRMTDTIEELDKERDALREALKKVASRIWSDPEWAKALAKEALSQSNQGEG